MDFPKVAFAQLILFALFLGCDCFGTISSTDIFASFRCATDIICPILGCACLDTDSSTDIFAPFRCATDIFCPILGVPVWAQFPNLFQKAGFFTHSFSFSVSAIFWAKKENIAGRGSLLRDFSLTDGGFPYPPLFFSPAPIFPTSHPKIWYNRK